MDIKRPVSRQPIPDHARKVFDGKIFDVYQWEQQLFDGSTATFEKIKRSDTVGVIPITANGKLILTEQQQPGHQSFIGCLGGRIDGDETPLEAVKRELLEEAGMEAGEIILWDAEQFLEKIDWAIYTFIAKSCSKVSEPSLDGGEQIKLIEVTFDEFLEIVAQDNFRDLEVALRVVRMIKSDAGLKSLKEVFLSK